MILPYYKPKQRHQQERQPILITHTVLHIKHLKNTIKYIENRQHTVLKGEHFKLKKLHESYLVNSHTKNKNSQR